MSQAHADLVAFLDFAVAGLRNRLATLDREHEEALTSLRQKIETTHQHLTEVDSENAALCVALDDYATKIQIRDGEIARLEVALEDALHAQRQEGE